MIEIDAASNRGIDQIRELREMVRYAPAAARSKVVILDRKNDVIASLGEGEYSKQDWASLRNQAAGTFVPGRFVCPHGACFDHEGNIFVVEWVEAGRVTKLRHVA